MQSDISMLNVYNQIVKVWNEINGVNYLISHPLFRDGDDDVAFIF